MDWVGEANFFIVSGVGKNSGAEMLNRNNLIFVAENVWGNGNPRTKTVLIVLRGKVAIMAIMALTGKKINGLHVVEIIIFVKDVANLKK